MSFEASKETYGLSVRSGFWRKVRIDGVKYKVAGISTVSEFPEGGKKARKFILENVRVARDYKIVVIPHPEKTKKRLPGIVRKIAFFLKQRRRVLTRLRFGV